MVRLGKHNRRRTAAPIEAMRASKEETDNRVFVARPDGIITAVQGRKSEETLSGNKMNVTLEPEEEQWGQKTAEVPNPTVYKSEDLEKLIDVAEVPDDLKPRIWEMLRRRINAFEFDGRLGHLEVKCRIRAKEGVEPISVPMYGSSPAKKQVIDEQLKTWFEQGVIEPSQSPWGLLS